MLNIDFLKKGSTEDYKPKAKRPINSGLINFKAKSELGVSFAGIEAGLVSYKFALNNGEFFDEES